MKNIFVFLLVLMTSNAVLASEVIKISKNKKGMAITHEFGTPWEVGQKICVKGKGGETYCGKVVKVQEAGALCQMSEPIEGIAPGDEVNSDDQMLNTGRSIEDPLDSVEKDESLDKKNQAGSRKKSGKRTFGLGLRGGMVIGNISSNDEDLADQDSRKALNFGVTLDLPLGRGTVSLEPSFNLTQKGYSNSFSTLKLSYLEFPLLFKIRLSRGGIIPFIYAGPYVGYLLSATTTLLLGDFDSKDTYKSFEFGLMGGLGFDFRVSSNFEIGISGNYGMGLSDILIDDGTLVKNRTIQALLHMLVQL